MARKLKSTTLNALKVMLAVVLACSVFLTGLGKTEKAVAAEGYLTSAATPEQILAKAESYLGKTYNLGSWDCSIYVSTVFNSFDSNFKVGNTNSILSYGISRGATVAQASDIDTIKNLGKAGDVLVFRLGSTTRHAGIYDGNGGMYDNIATYNTRHKELEDYFKYNMEGYSAFEPSQPVVTSAVMSANSDISVYGGGYVDNYYLFRGVADEGNIDLQKASSNPDITNNNKCYSLNGAQYGVYSNAECTSEVATLTTDGNGYANVENIKVGTYWVKEKSAPQGYALDTNSYQVTVKPNETVRVNGNFVQDRPQNDPVGILLGKYDGQRTYNGDKNLPQGSATLAGAEFTVKYYDGQYSSVEQAEASGNATRSWVYRTNVNGYVDPRFSQPVSGDSVYHDEAGGITFPLGTYVIYESKAPIGYLINNEKFIRNITSNTHNEIVNSYNTPLVKETVKRGDISFTKKTGIGGKPLSVPFKMTSLTTGESHIIMTDVNGMWSSANSWTAHSNNTNANDGAVSEDGTVDESKLTLEAGVWFGVDTAVNDNMRALPYDTYRFEELRTSVNKDYELVSFDIVVSVDDRELNIGTVDDELIPIVEVAKEDSGTKEYIKGAELLLEMKDDEGNWVEVARTVTDGKLWSVKVQDNREYRLTETKEPKTYLPIEPVEFFVPNQQKKTFVKMQDTPIHVKTEIDKSQTQINLSEDGKTATYAYTVDYRSNSNTWADELNMTDTFKCADENLAYLEYIQTPVSKGDYDGWMSVWYKTNKTDPDFDEDSKRSSASVTSPYNHYNPQNERIKDFKGYKLWRFGVNVFESETLKVEDLNLDEDEFITEIVFEHGRVNEGFTTQSEERQWTRNDHYNDTDTILDDKNIELGVDDNGFVTAKHEDGLQPAVFGMKVNTDVIGEPDVVLENKAVCDIHRNYDDSYTELNDNDEDEVNQPLPAIDTVALDIEDSDSVVIPMQENGILDTLTYSGLEVGKTYKVKATLMKKVAKEMSEGETDKPDSGEDSDIDTLSDDEESSEPDDGEDEPVVEYEGEILTIDGQPVETEFELTPNEANGEIVVKLAFNGAEADLMDEQELVVYERVFDGERLVATHIDINDEEQTVTVKVPSVKTYAVDGADGDKTITPSENNVVLDSVSYEKLDTGKLYVARATLMDKRTGEALRVDGETVTNEVEFVVDESETGTVEVSLEFNGRSAKLKDNQELVVYEEILDNNRLVASHTDINDSDQTVEVSVPKDEIGDLPNTGDEWIMFILATALIVLCVTSLIVSKKKE